MCAGYTLQNRREVEEDSRHLELDLLVQLLIGRDPLLARLHEVHGPRRWEIHDVRLRIWRYRREAAKQPQSVRAGPGCRYAEEIGS